MNWKQLTMAFVTALGIATTAVAQTAELKIISTSPTYARFIHAVPGATAMNCRLDRVDVFSNVPYGSAKGYVPKAPGSYLLDLTTPYGLTNFVAPDPLTLWGGIDTTILAVGSVGGAPPIETAIVKVPRYRVPWNEAHLIFIHAVPDAPPVDVLVDSAFAAPGLPYKGFEPPYPVKRGYHTVEVKLGGETILGPARYRTDGARKHTFVIMGTGDPTDGYPLMIKQFISQ
jgi:hypothetical protein